MAMNMVNRLAIYAPLLEAGYQRESGAAVKAREGGAA
jgi:hypothetical protein